MSTKISYIDTYLSDFKILVADLDNLISEENGSVNNIPENNCIEYIYSISKCEELNIFRNMLQTYFSRRNLTGNDIDYIIYCQSDMLVPKLDIAYSLQNEFDINNAQVLAINQGCSGTIMAMKIASALIDSNSANRVLILSSIFIEKHSDRITGPAILSDGLGIIELSKQDGILEIIDFIGKTDGSINEHNFYQGPNAAKIVSTGTKLIKHIVHRNGFSLDDVQWICPLNTGKPIWIFHCDKLQIPFNKVFLDVLPKGGHMGAVDTIRNLQVIISAHLLEKDAYIVLHAISYGTSWCLMLLKNTEKRKTSEVRNEYR